MQSPLISGTARNTATFPGPLQRRLVTDTYRLHTWRLGRSNIGIATTVTLDDLDLLL